VNGGLGEKLFDALDAELHAEAAGLVAGERRGSSVMGLVTTVSASECAVCQRPAA
jgi:hypothetical protein